MPKTVVLDELHLTVRIPADLPRKEVAAIRRILDRGGFLRRIRQALDTVVRSYPKMAPVRVTVGR